LLVNVSIACINKTYNACNKTPIISMRVKGLSNIMCESSDIRAIPHSSGTV